MRWGFPGILLAATLGLSGCHNFQQSKLVRPEKITSIVSLSPSTTEIVASSMVTNLLKGRTAADDYPRTVASVPIVASVKPDYEAIKAINPSIILLDSQLYSGSDLQKIKSLGSKVFVIDAKTISDFEKQMFELGDLLGIQTGQSDYADRIHVALSNAKGAKPATPVKVAVILPGRGGPPMINGVKSFLADVIDEDGGIAIGPPVDRFVPLNPETLTNENPDLIIIPTSKASAEADVKAILADPTLKGTKAVQNKAIAPIDEDVALRSGSRVDKLIDDVSKVFTFVGSHK
jgi:iron complex transport system substrate-binding protein